MSLQDYDYVLPPELIAQTPAEPRDASRLMLLARESGEPRHYRFRDLPELVRPGDALVFNDTRVLHARLRALRQPTGGQVELLLLRPLAGSCWEAMARPARRLRPGDTLTLRSGAVVRVTNRREDGGVEVDVPQAVVERLEEYGELPLPPYVTRYEGDPERYQTVYGVAKGSVAAPTAGLHFTPRLLEQLRASGVTTHYVTLHVGAGTFKPVQTERIDDHRMHAERFYVPADLPQRLLDVRATGGRVIAVGTTTARTLETVARRPQLAGRWAETEIFIRPGHEWMAIDGLLTNFHLPKSTLLMLVSALTGRERMLCAYAEAIEQGYRFYSFGDAMLIL